MTTLIHNPYLVKVSTKAPSKGGAGSKYPKILSMCFMDVQNLTGDTFAKVNDVIQAKVCHASWANE